MKAESTDTAAFQIWASHQNIVARRKERERFGRFFLCASILVIAGFAALLMILQGCKAPDGITLEERNGKTVEIGFYRE